MFGEPMKPFRQHVWIRPEFGLVEIALEDVSCYHEWIKGEGADISIWRAHDNDRVVGATLPLRNFKGEFTLSGIHEDHTLTEKAIKAACDEARKRVSGYPKGKRTSFLKRALDVTGHHDSGHGVSFRLSDTITGRSPGKLPKWQKPPLDVPVQALREFMAHYGADVSVLVTWTHETGAYQFVTIGYDQLYADSAVNLRNLIADKLALHPLNKSTEDLRGDHPNIKLNTTEIDFVLWVLGRLYAEKDGLGKGHKAYIAKHHDKLAERLVGAKAVLENQPM